MSLYVHKSVTKSVYACTMIVESTDSLLVKSICLVVH